MIELKSDQLVFSFPEIHPHAQLSINFQRTLRIPDNDKTYPLPPGLGSFPLRHVDDFASTAPAGWLERGGVMFPMYQSEAMWLHFNTVTVPGHWAEYPFAIKVAAGKIDAVTGEPWSNGLHPHPQDYMVAPGQPWLDGYCVEKGTIRQFVAMPLGSGYSAEEQITGRAEHGGLQIAAYPMKRDVFERRFPKRRIEQLRALDRTSFCEDVCACAPAGAAMGLAPGGRMKQEIYDDPFDFSDWDTTRVSRCFVHIANSMVWSAITGQKPPTPPPTAREYTRAGLPWFDYYADGAAAVPGSSILQKLKSVATLGKENGDVPLPENEPVSPENVVALRRRLGLQPGQVREGAF
jgi:hypothetical protein